MKWTAERLQALAEVTALKKIPRYFAIKKLVEKIVEEEAEEKYLRELEDKK